MIALVSSGDNVIVLSKEKNGLLSLWSLVQVQPLPAFISEARNQKVDIWDRSRCHFFILTVLPLTVLGNVAVNFDV